MTNLNPKNEVERKAVEMLNAGKSIHGELREVLIEMLLREEEKKN